MPRTRYRRGLRTIPPWWGNPIVFVPAAGVLAILLAVVAINVARMMWGSW